MILNCENVKSLMDFKHNNHQLAILNRQVPEDSNLFFSELNITPFSTSGYVSFENDLNISYKGKKNDILKKVEAGNIGLQLPSSQLVSVGSGSSEGLFGIKMVQQLGPLAIQSIISREQVKKSSKSSSVQSWRG